MLFLALAAIGLAASFMMFDMGDDDTAIPANGGGDEPDPDDAPQPGGSEPPVDPGPDNSKDDPDPIATPVILPNSYDPDAEATPLPERATGISAMWDSLETRTGTNGNDVLGLENPVFKSGEINNAIHGGAGNDLLRVHYAENFFADGGDGDDTISIESKPTDEVHDVLLGEGQDLVRYLETRAPDEGDIIAEIFDFNPAEDSIEILRDGAHLRPSYDEVETTLDPVEGTLASHLTISLFKDGETESFESYEFILHGIDPSQVDDIKIDITDAGEDPPDDRTVVEPVRDGNDLVFDIDSDNFRLPDFGDGPGQINLEDEEDNPLRDIERVVFNIDPDIDGEFYAFTEEWIVPGPKSGAIFDKSSEIYLVRGPEGIVGDPLLELSVAFDDNSYISDDSSDTHFYLQRAPEILAPFELLGEIHLGKEIDDFFEPERNQNTIREVEFVINRV